MVAFLIGPTRKLCEVHGSLLFRRAKKLQQERFKGKDAFKMDDVLPETTDLYIHYLYTDKIACNSDPSSVSPAKAAWERELGCGDR